MKLKDKIKWRNKNTDTIETGVIHGIFGDKIAIGKHYVSWLLIEDIEIMEINDEYDEPESKNNN